MMVWAPKSSMKALVVVDGSRLCDQSPFRAGKLSPTPSQQIPAVDEPCIPMSNIPNCGTDDGKQEVPLFQKVKAPKPDWKAENQTYRGSTNL